MVRKSKNLRSKQNALSSLSLSNVFYFERKAIQTSCREVCGRTDRDALSDVILSLVRLEDNKIDE